MTTKEVEAPVGHDNDVEKDIIKEATDVILADLTTLLSIWRDRNMKVNKSSCSKTPSSQI